MSTPRTHAIAIRVPVELYERIKAAAEADRRPVGAWCGLMLENVVAGPLKSSPQVLVNETPYYIPGKPRPESHS